VDLIQSGKMKFTDYNKLSPTPTVNRWVVPTAGYKPEWVVGTVNANVTVTFKPYFENLTHKRE
jgi:predicted DNA-binding ArsR family transcriptional regulator